jgi:hypothetical protein
MIIFFDYWKTCNLKQVDKFIFMLDLNTNTLAGKTERTARCGKK